MAVLRSTSLSTDVRHSFHTVIQLLAGASDSLPFPGVKGVLEVVDRFLQQMDIMENNRSSLEDLEKEVTRVLEIMFEALHIFQGQTDPRLEQRCQDFVRLLESMACELEKLHDSGRRRFRVKAFLVAKPFHLKIAGWKEDLTRLTSEFMLLTAIDTEQKVSSLGQGIGQIQDTIDTMKEILAMCRSDSQQTQARLYDAIKQMKRLQTKHAAPPLPELVVDVLDSSRDRQIYNEGTYSATNGIRVTNSTRATPPAFRAQVRFKDKSQGTRYFGAGSTLIHNGIDYIQVEETPFNGSSP